MARTDTLGHFLTDVADSIRSKSGTSEAIQASSFDTAISNIPTGGGSEVTEKDVNFYDYLGNLVYSYTKNEFLALSALPEGPTHTGMTFQEWNWNLSDAKTYVTAHGVLDIGETCITSDGKTRIYIEIPKDRKSITFAIALNGTVSINWGDNSTEETLSGSSATTLKSKTHTYSLPGEYVITLTNQGTIYLMGNSSYGTRLVYNTNTDISGTGPYGYGYFLKKAEIGSNIVFRNYCFMNSGLESINYPALSENTQSYSYHFYGSNLKYITLPNKLTTLGNLQFYYTKNLKKVSFPNSITTFNTQAFEGSRIEKIIMPDSVTTMDNKALKACDNLKKIILSNNITILSDECITQTVLTSLILSNNITTLNNKSIDTNKNLTYIEAKGNITTINSQAIFSNILLKTINFQNNTSIPTLTANAISGASDLQIVVPDSLYENWITASNWSSYSSKIIKASDYIE